VTVLSGPGSFHEGEHVMHCRVYWEDTDAAGIVYYANYLKFAERGRTEALRAAGIEQSTLRQNHKVGFVVKRCTIEFFRSAKLDDLLTIKTRLLDIGRVSMNMSQTIHCGGAVVAELVVRLAAVGARMKPVRIPASVAKSLGDRMKI
jgi:acyl-CoA thioester hydrolase